jgi:hypothetical protein
MERNGTTLPFYLLHIGPTTLRESTLLRSSSDCLSLSIYICYIIIFVAVLLLILIAEIELEPATFKKLNVFTNQQYVGLQRGVKPASEMSCIT